MLIPDDLLLAALVNWARLAGAERKSDAFDAAVTIPKRARILSIAVHQNVTVSTI